MPKRSSKPFVATITPQDVGNMPPSSGLEPEQPTKNPAAVALGRLGGLKGGKARAAKLSATKRKAIARKAAEARWIKQKGCGGQ